MARKRDRESLESKHYNLQFQNFVGKYSTLIFRWTGGTGLKRLGRDGGFSASQ
jgi:hypothetical protein